MDLLLTIGAIMVGVLLVFMATLMDDDDKNDNDYLD